MVNEGVDFQLNKYQIWLFVLLLAPSYYTQCVTHTPRTYLHSSALLYAQTTTKRKSYSFTQADLDTGGHDIGGIAPAAAAGAAHGQMRYTHITFFWGSNSEILFNGWPGARGGMYALALVVVFTLAVLLEYLGCRRLEARFSWSRRVAAGLACAAVHAARLGAAYLLMLALMSFNVGVFIVAVAGHAVGFLVFRTAVCGGRNSQVEDGCKEELAPMACF